MKIDTGSARRRELKHELGAPQGRTERVAYARLAFVVDGIGFGDPKRQPVGAAILLELLERRYDLLVGAQELRESHVRRSGWSVGIIVARQKHEPGRIALGQCSDPGGFRRNVRSGEAGIGHARSDCIVE
jgi:hypothetical protein